MRMSWFDASGIASLATKALKEAQKTIDKALDIKDEDDQSSPTYSQVSPVEESDNFFSSWGLKSPTKPMKSSSSVELEDDGNDSGISEKASSSGITSVMTSSLWGSFTGSFFENSRTPDNDNTGNDRVPVFNQPKRSQSTSVSEDTSTTAAIAESLSYKTSYSEGQDGTEKRMRRPSRNAAKVEGVVEGVDDEEVDAFSDSRVVLVVRDEDDEEEECSNTTRPLEDQGGNQSNQSENIGPELPSGVISGESEPNVGDVVLYNSFFSSKLSQRNEEVGNGVTPPAMSLRPKVSASELPPQEDELDEEVVSPSSSSVSPHTPSSSGSSPSSAPSRDTGHASEGGTTGGKRSSESVEVLGSCEEGCATSPEGDIGTGIIESVPVHLGPHGRTPPFSSSGFLKFHTGELVSSAKPGGGIYDPAEGGATSRQQDVRVTSVMSIDQCSGKGTSERSTEKGTSTPTEVKERVEGPSIIGKGWDCRTDTTDAVSGHGSPESVEVIPEDGDVATSPSSVEVIGGSTSSRTPSISASTSTRPSSSSSSVSPTTPGNGSSSGFALLEVHDDVVGSSVICNVVPEGAGAASVEGQSSDGASETIGRKLNAPVDDTSPENVEVIPEEVEEEEMSSSASSTTTTTAVTVLEQQRTLAGVDTRPASVLVTSCGSLERSLREDEAEEAGTSLESFKGKDVCDSGREKATPCETEELKTSSYLRNLLADAMQEKEDMAKGVNSNSGLDDAPEKQAKDDNLLREQSPLSSEKSDLVKVGEEEMSGQTSGDEELDTTTSSDIEIISSPNGVDSGSSKSESRRRGPGMAAKMSSTSRQGALAAAPSPSPSTASSSSSSSSFSMVGRGMSGSAAHREERQLAKLSDHTATLLELRESFRGEGERLHHLHHFSQLQRFPSGHHLLLEQCPTSQVSEVEELTKRLSETSDILEARESKLIELSRSNVELQEQNMELTRKLKEAEAKCSERETARVEFEGRLATLDRKLQQANGENELLRMKLKEKMDELSRRENSDLASLLKEKEEECLELREEGEKLSKQEMNLTTIIKNLRAAQKNSEKTISSLRQRLEESENELERVKRSLGMREEVERTQVEAIHNLKMSLEAAERETSELLSKVDAERKALSDEKRSLEDEKEQWNEREQELLAAIEFGRLETERLRETLSKVQEDHTKREEAQRMERLVLERRLVEVEARGEEVGAQASKATRPLLRQLESLQTIARQREAAWEATEKELLGKLAEAEGKAKIAADKERSGRQRCATLTSRVSSLESQLMTLRKEVETEASLSKENLKKQEREVARLEGERMKLEEALSECKRCNVSLEERLSVERAAVEAEKRRNALLQDQLREHLQQKQSEQNAQQQMHHHHHKGTPPSPRSSPTLSFGHASLDESITSSAWLPLFQEDGFHDGRSVNSVFEGHAGIMAAAMTTSSSSSLIESLQSQLKLRDGEVQQLQWELGRGESERNALTTEVSTLTARVSDLESALTIAKADSGKLSDLQTKYDALLQMYGEKVEETEELRLDLQDVKEMYKTQIDQLTKKADSI